MDFTVDTDVAMPEDRVKYPFEKLTEVGHSGFLPGFDKSVLASIRSSACAYAKRHNVRFSVRKVEEKGTVGIRVWRVG